MLTRNSSPSSGRPGRVHSALVSTSPALASAGAARCAACVRVRVCQTQHHTFLVVVQTFVCRDLRPPNCGSDAPG